MKIRIDYDLYGSHFADFVYPKDKDYILKIYRYITINLLFPKC